MTETEGRRRPTWPRSTPRRAVLALTIALLVTFGSTAIVDIGPAAAGGGPDPTGSPAAPTTSTTLPEPDRGVPGRIIPEPESGIAPEDPGDRGGWQQWAVLGLMGAGLMTIAVLVSRESLRKRARRGGASRPPGTSE